MPGLNHSGDTASLFLLACLQQAPHNNSCLRGLPNSLSSKVWLYSLCPAGQHTSTSALPPDSQESGFSVHREWTGRLEEVNRRPRQVLGYHTKKTENLCWISRLSVGAEPLGQ